MSSDTYFPRITGVASAIKNLRNNLHDKGHTTSLIVPKFPENDYRYSMYNIDDDNIHRIPSMRTIIDAESRLMVPLYKKRIENIADNFGPDVIHVHNEFMALHLVRKYSIKRNIPLIASFRTNFWHYGKVYVPPLSLLNDERYNQFIVKFIKNRYQNVSHVVVLTKSFKRMLLENNIHNSVYIIPSGISSNEFFPDDYERIRLKDKFYDQNPGLKNHKILVYVARLSSEKNIDFLIDLANLLKNRYRKFKLFLIGDGPAKNDIYKKVKSMGLTSIVELLGYLHKSEIKKYLCAADLFVTASKSETMGNSVVEAMSCKLPVVGLNSPGIGDVLENETGGFLSNNLTDFAENVIRLIEYPRLFYKKAKEAYFRSLEFQDVVCTQKYIDLYKHAISPQKDNKTFHFKKNFREENIEIAS